MPSAKRTGISGPMACRSTRAAARFRLRLSKIVLGLADLVSSRDLACGLIGVVVNLEWVQRRGRIPAVGPHFGRNRGNFGQLQKCGATWALSSAPDLDEVLSRRGGTRYATPGVSRHPHFLVCMCLTICFMFPLYTQRNEQRVVDPGGETTNFEKTCHPPPHVRPVL